MRGQQGTGRAGEQGAGRGAGSGRGSGRGGGRGRMGGPSAGGPGGKCVCTACGFSTPHVPGTPCMQSKCPQCGAAMARE